MTPSFKGVPLLKVDPKPARVAVERAAAVLRNGWLVVLPVDTGYVLAGDARNPEAASILARLSGSTLAGMPTCLMAYGKQVLALAEDLSEPFWEASRQWPAKALTLLIKPASWVPTPLTKEHRSAMAVRLPDSPLLWSLVEKLEWPVAAVEFPRSPSPAAALDLAGPAAGKVRLLLDGGKPKKSGLAVLDVRAKYARILKRGSLQAAG